ncbi:MAG: hypothetical protein ACI306_08935, partial [Muribaculaceae bacterium]
MASVVSLIISSGYVACKISKNRANNKAERCFFRRFEGAFDTLYIGCEAVCANESRAELVPAMPSAAKL